MGRDCRGRRDRPVNHHRATGVKVNIDINHGASYGQTIFIEKTVKSPAWLWKVATVQIDLDKDKFYKLYVDLMSASKIRTLRKVEPMKRIRACVVLLAMCAAAPAVAQQPQKIIFDTDFAYPPQDDAMALFFVLNRPELQLLGITTVAGNRSLNVATPTH